VYYRHAAEKQMEFLLQFDAASVVECYQRPESIVPQQALALANSALVQAQSRLLARRIMAEIGGTAPGEFVRIAFEYVLGRLPTAEEGSMCEQFLAEQQARLGEPKHLAQFSPGTAASVPPAPDPRLRAKEGLVQVLLNHHEFVTIR
jgi:hypothetical protein